MIFIKIFLFIIALIFIVLGIIVFFDPKNVFPRLPISDESKRFWLNSAPVIPQAIRFIGLIIVFAALLLLGIMFAF